MMSLLQEGLAPLQTLDDMQCMWFQRELARAYWRLGQYGESLVKFHEIDKVNGRLMYEWMNKQLLVY